MTLAAAIARAATTLSARGRGGLAEAERLAEAVLRGREYSPANRAAVGSPESGSVSKDWILKSAPISRAELLVRGGDALSSEQERGLVRLTAFVAEGTPLQHVTGTQFFHEHEYEVGPAALIPRAETELLIVESIRDLRAGPPPRRGLEIGLGAGVLSIELLAAFSGLCMVATELSADAVALARQNARRILGPGPGTSSSPSGESRLAVFPAGNAREVWEPVLRASRSLFDFVISNPPYLVPGEATEEVAAHEPASALWAPEGDADYFYRMLATPPAGLLAPRAGIFLELPHERAEAIAAIFPGARLLPDLTGRSRILLARSLA